MTRLRLSTSGGAEGYVQRERPANLGQPLGVVEVTGPTPPVAATPNPRGLAPAAVVIPGFRASGTNRSTNGFLAPAQPRPNCRGYAALGQSHGDGSGSSNW